MVVLQENINNEIKGKYDYYYEIYSDNTLIGFSSIRKDSNDMLYIYIHKNYRGNNLGNETFNKILQKFKELGINEISVIIDNNNIQMIRIINHHKFIIIGDYNNFKIYKLKI